MYPNHLAAKIRQISHSRPFSWVKDSGSAKLPPKNWVLSPRSGGASVVVRKGPASSLLRLLLALCGSFDKEECLGLNGFMLPQSKGLAS